MRFYGCIILRLLSKSEAKKLGPHHKWMRALGEETQKKIDSGPTGGPLRARRKNARHRRRNCDHRRHRSSSCVRHRRQSSGWERCVGRYTHRRRSDGCIGERSGDCTAERSDGYIEACLAGCTAGCSARLYCGVLYAPPPGTAIRRRTGLRGAALPHHRRIHLNASARIGRRELRPRRSCPRSANQSAAHCFRLAQVHDSFHRRCSEPSHFCPPGEPKRRHPPLEVPPLAGALPPVMPREGDPLGEAAMPRCARSRSHPVDGLPN